MPSSIPADRDVAGVARILDLGVGLDPVEPLALLAPEFRRIGDRFLIELFVFRLVDPGAGGDRGRDGNGAVIRHRRRLPFGFAGRISRLRARNKERVNHVLPCYGRVTAWPCRPFQVRLLPPNSRSWSRFCALRAAKAPASVQATAPIQSAAPVQAKPAVIQSAPAQTFTTAASGPMPSNRPRGSLLNILA